MQLWQELLAAAILLSLVLAVRSALRKGKDRKYRDALRKLELVMQPRESIKVILPQKKGRIILTSKRVGSPLCPSRPSNGFRAITKRATERPP